MPDAGDHSEDDDDGNCCEVDNCDIGQIYKGVTRMFDTMDGRGAYVANVNGNIYTIDNWDEGAQVSIIGTECRVTTKSGGVHYYTFDETVVAAFKAACTSNKVCIIIEAHRAILEACCEKDAKAAPDAIEPPKKHRVWPSNPFTA